MEFIHINRGDVLIITPQFETLDARDSREFREKILDLITKENSHNVIIDLQKVHFVDSSGLGAFLAILKYLHAQGGELRLSAMNKPIRSIFELISLHKIFEIFNSTEDALNSFIP